MSVFVDTSVWINYLAGHKTEKAGLLFDLVASGQPIYTLPVIVQEILQGLKNDKHLNLYIDKFEALNHLSFSFEDAIEAAQLYRMLRKKGITATTIDLQIVAICLRYKLKLLTEDKDFRILGDKVGLTLA